jgi:hypothetical protein
MTRELLARMARQGLELEIEEFVDIQCPCLVGLEKLLIARLINLAVEDLLFNEKLRPLKITVTRQQGVVQIKQRELHEHDSKDSLA